MSLERVRKSVSRLIIAVMVLACMASPVSAAADVSISCDDVHSLSVDVDLSDDKPSDDAAPEAVDHPLHHCGGCHIHILAEAGGEKVDANNILSLRPDLNRTIAGQSSPDGPYRPPRV
tara:strand:- start:4447 stop:4800 length:354 start_codon:yes stop_codon:yes gene_type:complete